MNRRMLVACMVAAWAVVFSLSFVMAKATPAVGDGFTRGLNRLNVFAAWQLAALILALAIWVVNLRELATSSFWRWLRRLPIFGELALVLFVVSVFGYFAWFNKPDVNEVNPAPAKPVASPTAVVAPETTEIESAPKLEVFQGVIHRVFETSSFYTLDGGGPYWIDASDAAWEKLNEYFVERPGRGSGILVIASFQGYRTDGVDIPTLGSYESSVFIERVDSARSITQEEFEMVLDQKRNEK